MNPEEIEALRRAADEVWAIARKLEQQGFWTAAQILKEAADDLHTQGRLSSLPPE